MTTLYQQFSENEVMVWRNAGTSTNSTTFVNFTPGAELMSVAFKKILDSSVVVVELYTSCYHNHSGDVDWGVRINGVDYNLIRGYHDNSDTHRGFHATREISGIPAGTYTIQARWKRTTTSVSGESSSYAVTDVNDTQSMVVRERKVSP
jgi:hypothetical protein